MTVFGVGNPELSNYHHSKGEATTAMLLENEHQVERELACFKETAQGARQKYGQNLQINDTHGALLAPVAVEPGSYE